MRRRAGASRAGVALLETLIALIVMGIVGIAILEVVASATKSTRSAWLSEERIRRASQLLQGYAIMNRHQLEQRIGEQGFGALRIRVTRPRPGVFRVSAVDTLALERELLVTLLHRPGDQ